MFETATLRSGYSLQDTQGFAERVERMLRLSLDVPLDAKVCFQGYSDMYTKCHSLNQQKLAFEEYVTYELRF